MYRLIVLFPGYMNRKMLTKNDKVGIAESFLETKFNETSETKLKWHLEILKECFEWLAQLKGTANQFAT